MQQDLLTIETIPGDGRVSLRVRGEIDLSTASALRGAALAALTQHSTVLLIDLSGVTFMDSTGLEVLIATRRRAELMGVQLHLVDPGHTVRRILHVSGVDRLFQIDPGQAPAPV